MSGDRKCQCSDVKPGARIQNTTPEVGQLVVSCFERLPLSRLNDPRKDTKQKWFRAVLCDFVDRSCRSGEKYETELRHY